MTTSTEPSVRLARKSTTRLGLALTIALAVIASLLAPATAGAQDSDRTIMRGEEQTLKIEQAPDTPTFGAVVASPTGSGHTVIFEAPGDGSGVGIAGAPPSCAYDCIELAWLSSNLSSTALTLDVETDVDASIRYWVGTHVPLDAPDGLPYFITDVVTGHTFIDTDSWTTTVDGLAANTVYYIIVEATDKDGDSHSEFGSFRTVTPAIKGIPVFDSHGDGGCSLECITTANLVTYDEPDRVGWVVETLVPTVMVVLFSDKPVVWAGDIPQFEGAASVDASAAQYEFETQFIDSVNGLTTATLYNVIISATDENGNTDHFVGQIHTPAVLFDLIYAPLRTIVHESGDAVGRGELRFTWEIGDAANPLFSGSRPRAKIADGESFYFGPNTNYTVFDVAENEQLPNFSMLGLESDLGFWPAFIIPGEVTGLAALHGWIYNGFYGAQTPADLDNLDKFPICASFVEIADDHPWAHSPCVRIDTYQDVNNTGSSVTPQFTTILAIYKTPAA